MRYDSCHVQMDMTVCGMISQWMISTAHVMRHSTHHLVVIETANGNFL